MSRFAPDSVSVLIVEDSRAVAGSAPSTWRSSSATARESSTIKTPTESGANRLIEQAPCCALRCERRS